jgi:hypothetical protein
MNSMTLRKIFLLLISIFLLCFLLLFVLILNRFLVQREAVNEFRVHVFCEELKPRMSRVEVEEILSMYGDYTLSESSIENSNVDFVVIRFKDQKIDHQFGGQPIGLRFDHGEYYNAYISKFLDESNQPICTWGR